MTRSLAAATALIALLALPAAAAASNDLAITQVPSAKVVDKGGQVSFAITITNKGTEAYENVYVNLFSLRGHGQGADAPYQSVSVSQGTCKDSSGDAYGYHYYGQVCELGPLASGAGARITAVVKANESFNHLAALLPNAYEGGFNDDNAADNEAVTRITASIPPTLSGSKKIKVSGLPTGCASDDFTLRVSTAVKGVKKMGASLFLGFDQNGEGQELHKVSKGTHLKVKVPVSRIEPELNATYDLKLKAKRGGPKPLKLTVTFQIC